MVMNLKNIHIAKSALTDDIYAGYVNKDGQTWRDKKNVTSEFLAAVVARWNGYKQMITVSNGKRYEVAVREVKR